MNESLLQLTAVTKSFGAVRALQGVSFDLHPGEVHALLGENGAGKSTLIKIIAGAHAPDSGTVELQGKVVPHLTPAAAHQRGVACIYQQPALFPDLTVAENIALRLQPLSVFGRADWRAWRAQAAALLDRINAHLSPDAEVRSLSMPEQQLVEIACALGAGARIVIMDEPTSSLTQPEVELLFGIVRDLRASGVGLIYISHRLDEIFRLADRVTVLRDGESVGTRRLRARPLPEPGATPAALETGNLTESDLIRLMVGREVLHIYPPPEGEPGKVVLSLRDVASAAGGVKRVSFEVRAGEVVGLAGLVGAGRTELARVLFGITPADAGEILIANQPVRIASPQDAAAHGIAYVPEDRRRHGVILEMPVAHNMTLAVHRTLFPGSWLRLGAERAFALDFIRNLAVKTSSPDAPAASLSGGNQQKVSLARWLATKPRILILDEPTQGVDVGAKSEIHRFIRRLARDGLAVLLISSDLPEIVGMSDRIAVMRGGTVVTTLPAGSDAHAVMAAALGAGAALQPEPELRPEATRTPENETPSVRSVPRPWTSFSREISVVGALVLMLLGLALFTPNFFEPQPLLSRLTAAAPRLVLACGVALVLIVRQIDISIGSLFAVCGTCAGLLAQQIPLGVAFPAAVAAGALGGAVNGALIAGLGLPSIVVTLATMVTLREALRLYQQGVFINLPQGAQWFGLPMAAGQFAVCGIALGTLVLLAWGLRHRTGGRFLYAIGSDTEAARLAGLRPRWTTFLVFTFMGALAGLAAILNLVQSPQVDPNGGRGLELEAIAAAVVGGVAVSGGRGTLWGVLAGLLLLVCVGPALTYAGVKPHWEKAVQGAIILLAVVTEGIRRRRE
jgi:ABC-type sugar transport system ATPase subunit/ribose/xylose/arabinose/galactoside ABC-type transport system permease subunit